MQQFIPQIDQLKAAILYDNKTLENCIIALYDKQTSDEQITMSTSNRNNVGYNSSDAEHMSRYAETIKTKTALTTAELYDARRRIIKYAKQLMNIIDEHKA